MVAQDDGSKEDLESRPPMLEDLLSLCKELNAKGAQYVIVGGMAMIHLGFTRSTEDIDLIFESSPLNLKKAIDALATLPDKASAELTPEEILKYRVVRIADEIVVDVMLEACGLSFKDCISLIDWDTIEGVKIPFASKDLMIKLKQGARDKDKLDLSFLLRPQN